MKILAGWLEAETGAWIRASELTLIGIDEVDHPETPGTTLFQVVGYVGTELTESSLAIALASAATLEEAEAAAASAVHTISSAEARVTASRLTRNR